ncbi:MAG: hypothetical protein GY847_02110 [Proteobacteria bacterium]|nr:hypothetical protein [Pseudomonadota bacterium]
MSLTFLDRANPQNDERLVTLGRSSTDKLLVLVHLDKDEETIRLISARSATRREKQSYERERR